MMSFIKKIKALFLTENNTSSDEDESAVETAKYLDRSYYSDDDWLKLMWLAKNVKTWDVYQYDYISCRLKESVDDDNVPSYHPVYSKRPSMAERFFSKAEFYDMKRELGLMEKYNEN